MKENDEKLSDGVKTEVQADIDALKSALAGEDDTAVKTALDKLNESQQKLGEEIYAQSQAEAAAEEAAPDAEQGNDEDIVDAEVVDDEPTENK
jgi:molecular chaperone DnaK